MQGIQTIALASVLLVIGGLGCGSSPVEPSSSSSAVTGSTNNWSIAGTRANGDPVVLAATLMVSGASITGTASQLVCNTDAAVGLTGQIAPDGSFTLSSSPLNDPALTITGKGLTTTASTWTGNYTFTSGSGVTRCAAPASNFTARPVMNMSGTYAGTASSASLGGGATVSLQVTQAPTAGPSPNYYNVLSYLVSGTASIANSPCFTSGIFASTSQLIGDTLYATLAMNDGSAIQVIAYLGDSSAGSLVLAQFTVSGGKCNNLGALGTLKRQ